jgi:N-methylhydantoinase B
LIYSVDAAFTFGSTIQTIRPSLATIGGIDSRSGHEFSYYETVAGGMGARPSLDGMSGVHTHMTNSLNTPAEALEYAYPLRVREYRLRRGSGGEGKHRGGDGVVREIEFLSPADVTLLTERRRLRPYGLRGGGEGQPGENAVLTSGRPVRLPAKVTLRVGEGGRLRVATPGGGAWGARKRRH